MKKMSFFKGISAALVAWAMFVASANAFTVTPGTFNPGDVELEINRIWRYDISPTSDPEPAAFTVFKFENLIGNPIPTLSVTTVNQPIDFDNLQIFWSSDASGSTGSAISAIVSSTSDLLGMFFGAGETKWLTVSWDAINDGGNVDLKISAVPIPPALLLFGTSLAGLGFLSRRRRRKTGSKMVAA